MTDNQDPHKPKLDITESPPPAWSLCVYVAQAENGFQARAGNLPDLTATAGDQRAAMKKLVEAAKAKLREAHEAGQKIEWLDPPKEPAQGEAVFWLALHL